MTAHDDSHHPTIDAIDAVWREQERLRRAVAARQGVPDVDRALYAALADAQLPPPPADFVAATVAAAERSLEARRRIAALRARLLRLFGLSYLPAMLVVAALFAADLPAAWLHADPMQRLSLQWMALVALLAGASTLAARIHRRRIDA